MEEAKQPLKILMTADTVGGVWTYCMELCRFLQPMDCTVHLVTMGAPLQPAQQAEADAVPGLVVHETDYKLEWMQQAEEDIQECGDWLLQLEEELQPDLVHLNCFAYGALPFKAPVVVVAHSDVYSWFLSVKGEDPPTEWVPYYRCVKEGLEGADLVIAPSQAMLDFVTSIYGLTGEKTVIYNGRDASLFRSVEKEPFVFSMGRVWDEAKNIKLLTDAAPSIRATVKVAGDNHFAGNTFEATHTNVTLTGKLNPEEVAEQLSTASVYVLPARYEPFGLSVLEAALSGCALVIGNLPSLREIWGDAALYTDTDNPAVLAALVNELLEDEAKRREYSNRAIGRATIYSSERMARQYRLVYRDLLQHSIQPLKTETAPHEHRTILS